MKLSKKPLIATFIFASSVTMAICQQNNAVSKPTMPTMPVVPSVSKPTINGFFVPSSSDFYTGNKQFSSNQQLKNTASKINKSNEKSEIPQIESLSEIVKASNLPTISNSKKDKTQLTASDISSLENLGLFGSLSGLLSKQNSSLQDSNNTKSLEKILDELKELKLENKSESKIENTTSINASFATTQNESKVLRFVANNTDCLKILKDIYISKEEIDGTFLLTGDCKYSQNGKSKNEIFYMLFKSKGIENSIPKYSVSISVSNNDSSETFLSRLAELSETSEITAIRTGNLVTMRVNESNLKFDLLLTLEK